MAEEIKTGAELGLGLTTLDRLSLLAHDIHRIANAQEALLEIAQEARKNRATITEGMQKMFKKPLDIPPLGAK